MGKFNKHGFAFWMMVLLLVFPSAGGAYRTDGHTIQKEIISANAYEESKRRSGSGVGPCKFRLAAEFTSGENWRSLSVRRPLEISFDKGGNLTSPVMAVRYGSNATTEKVSVLASLQSDVLAKQAYSKIHAITLMLAGNLEDDRLRVILRDATGERFTPKHAIRLNFDRFMRDTLHYDVGDVTHRGGDNNGEMDPPLQIESISIVGSSGPRAPVKLSKLMVSGVSYPEPAVGECARQTDEAEHASVNGGLDGDVWVDVEPATRVLEAGVEYGLRVKLTAPGNFAPVPAIIVRRMLNASMKNVEVMPLHRTSTGAYSSRIRFPEPGVYEVTLQVSDGGGRHVSVLQSRHVLVWNSQDHDATADASEFFGAMASLDIFSDKLEQDLQLLRSAGVGIVRFPFRWSRIEKNREEYAWSLYDRIFRLLQEHGIRPQPLVIQTPEWARRTLPDEYGNGNKYSRVGFTPPGNLQDFTVFIEKAALRYKDYEPYWEIWNEPHAEHYWLSGTKEEYLALLKAGYKAIKSVAPESKVLTAGMGGVASGNSDFMSYIIENGFDYFDIIAIHSHGPAGRLYSVFDSVNSKYDMKSPGKPVWLNESGVAVNSSIPGAEIYRASEIVKKIVLSKSAGVQNFGWFILRQPDRVHATSFNNYAALDIDGQPRPVVLAYKNSVNRLHDVQSLRKVHSSGGIQAYRFFSPGKEVVVLWVEETPATQMRANVDSGGYCRGHLYDLFGGLIMESRAVLGHMSLPVSNEPSFLVLENSSC